MDGHPKTKVLSLQVHEEVDHEQLELGNSSAAAGPDAITSQGPWPDDIALKHEPATMLVNDQSLPQSPQRITMCPCKFPQPSVPNLLEGLSDVEKHSNSPSLRVANLPG